MDGRVIETTAHEFAVLRVLAANPGIVFSREALIRRAWGADTHVTERSVDTIVKRLRQKIETNPAEPVRLLTVWGVGYRFDPEPAADADAGEAAGRGGADE